MKYTLKFDRDAVIKAALLAAGAALVALQQAIPTLGLDPLVAAVAAIAVGAAVAAISKAEGTPEPPKP